MELLAIFGDCSAGYGQPLGFEPSGDFVIVERALAILGIDDLLNSGLDAVPTGFLAVAAFRSSGEEITLWINPTRGLHVLVGYGTADGRGIAIELVGQVAHA